MTDESKGADAAAAGGAKKKEDKPCSKGRKCAREDCWFQHPDGREIDDDAKKAAEADAKNAKLGGRKFTSCTEEFFEWLRAKLRSKGGRVLQGYTTQQIEAIESKHGFRFPPDHRAFLRAMRVQAEGWVDWLDSKSEAKAVERMRWSFDVCEDFDEQQWTEQLASAGVDAASQGLLPPELPAAEGERKALTERRIQALRRSANVPTVIPLYSHRYTISDTGAEHCEWALVKNAVLSIYGSDMIPYGYTFSRYILEELARGEFDLGHESDMRAEYQALGTIPFWGQYLG